MDELTDVPEKVAEDIMKQAKIGFSEEATQRIIRILTAYHQLREELAEIEKQNQTEANVIFDGTFVWRIIEGQREGPYCGYCYGKNKDWKKLIDHKKGQWQCPECEKYHHDESFNRPTHSRRSPRSPMQF